VLEYRGVGIMALFYYPALQCITASRERQKGSPAKVVRKDQSGESGRARLYFIGVPKREIGPCLEADISGKAKKKRIKLKKGRR
jgi:hypothetical protein